MKKIRRWLAAFMIMAVISTIFPADFWNDNEIRGGALYDGYFKYQLLTDGTVRIDGYIGDNKDVYIPATIVNKPVTKINPSAFNNNSNIELVDLSSTQIVEVGELAFANCENLKKVVLPKTLKAISRKLFYNSRFLEEVEIPEGVTSIAIGAFSGCTALREITIPDSVTSMKSSSSSDQTFDRCTSLQSVKIGDGVDEIGPNTFMDCDNLAAVTLGKSITKIGNNAFKGCKALQSISIPDKCTAIGSESFGGCISLTEVNLGMGVKTIDTGAFSGCTSLACIVFPDSLTLMKSSTSKSTFGKCESLKTIVFGEGLTSIPEYAFKDCIGLEEVYVGGSLESIKGSVFNSCSMLKALYCMDEKCPSIDSMTTFDYCAEGFTIYCLENSDKLGTYSFPSKAFDKTDKICEVTFDTNGAQEQVIKKEAIIGRPISPIQIPLKDGYQFEGWYNTPDCSGEKVDFSKEIITENVTFYAKWDVNSYTLTFDPMYDGKVEEVSRVVRYGDPVGELPVPTRENYKFLGWFQGQNGSGDKYTPDTLMQGKDTIIHAAWEQVVSVRFPAAQYALQTTEAGKIEYVVTPADAYDSTLSWESSDEDVVTVDQNGTIKALRKGTATITATTVSGKQASCEVTVTIKPSLSLNRTIVSAYVGETSQLTAKVVGESTKVTFKSSDSSIASVDQNGKITTKAIGSAVISASANGLTVTCNVNVLHVDLDLNLSRATIYTKGKTKVTLNAQVSGRNHNVVWRTSNPAIASVSRGLVVAKKAGTVTISATANKITRTCRVTVKKPTLTVKKTSLKVKKKKKVKISYKLTPSAKVTFTNKTPKIIKVTTKGVVTGKKKGTGKVVVNGLGLKKTVKIKVK